MSKHEPKVYTRVNWPVFKGKRIVWYSLPSRLPYTREQLIRREARLMQSPAVAQVASSSESV